MQKTEILEMTLSQFNFHTNTRNRLIDKVLRKLDALDEISVYRDLHFKSETSEKRPQKEILAHYCLWAEKITVAQVMEAIYERPTLQKSLFVRGVSEMLFYKKVEQLGLTREDWICLPKRVLKTEICGNEDKEDLLKKDILSLGTVTDIFLGKIKKFLMYYSEKKDVYNRIYLHEMSVTIGEFITLYNPDGYYKDESLLPSAKKTREKLVSLGFWYEDGVFMQLNTKRKLIEDLMEKEGLSKRDATLVIETCRRQFRGVNWVYEE